MTLTIAYQDANGYVDVDLGWTEWLTITQERVSLFAETTDDHQWIHVDPARAAAGPFGAPVAHGFLSLSLTVKFWSELLVIPNASACINYGLEKVRFVSAVEVGARVRGNAVIAAITEVPGALHFTVDQTIVAEGASRPAVVARGLYRFYA